MKLTDEEKNVICNFCPNQLSECIVPINCSSWELVERIKSEAYEQGKHEMCGVLIIELREFMDEIEERQDTDIPSETCGGSMVIGTIDTLDEIREWLNTKEG